MPRPSQLGLDVRFLRIWLPIFLAYAFAHVNDNHGSFLAITLLTSIALLGQPHTFLNILAANP